MTTLEMKVQGLLDREAIRDLLHRYCRGIDRCDEELLRGVYWPGAIDDHSAGFVGVAEDFIKKAISLLAGDIEVVMHHLSNIQIQLEGDVAKVESYFQAFHKVKQPKGGYLEYILAGRYLDRMERRNDEWRIAHRVVACDWNRFYPDSLAWKDYPSGEPTRLGGKKPNDYVYELTGSAS